MPRLLALLLSATLAACASAPPPAPTPGARTVVLVSLDGFRAADLGRGMTPTLDAIARDGVRAEAMRPSYPTLTFPNHYTLVTGLVPDHHGIVHNTVVDAALGRFHYSLAGPVQDARWWGGEPLWSTAEKAGLRTATMFWPGSEAPIGGVRPTQWRPYDAGITGVQRVDTVLRWLDQPAATRPRFVTLYFEDLDDAAHDHGPDSAQAQAAVRGVDGYVARLRAGIASRGLADLVDLVVVSDHGMAPVAASNIVLVDDIVSPDLAEAVTTGQALGFRPRPGRESEAARRLLGRHAHYACWSREALPPQWRFGRHPRVPPIVCQMDEGWDAVTRKGLEKNPRTGLRGSHGYAPELPSMAALFVADGPSFRDGVVLPAFDNVDVYPMLARLVGVTPQPNDGDPETFAPALR